MASLLAKTLLQHLVKWFPLLASPVPESGQSCQAARGRTVRASEDLEEKTAKTQEWLLITQSHSLISSFWLAESTEKGSLRCASPRSFPLARQDRCKKTLKIQKTII